MARDYSDRYQKLLKKLAEARKKTGLKQIEVAEKLGKPQSFISKIESGERKVSFTEVEDLSRLYEVNLTYFETSREDLVKCTLLSRPIIGDFKVTCSPPIASAC